jgi:hypothetical protein
MVTAMMVAYRDESTFADSLGIIGAGPIGGYTPSAVVQNADGYRYVVAPMVDGFTWQGFKVDGNLNIKQDQPGMGLRQPIGNDPAENLLGHRHVTTTQIYDKRRRSTSESASHLLAI